MYTVGNAAKPVSSGPRVRFEAKNWRQLTDRQLAKLTPIERSRYLAVSTYHPVKLCEFGSHSMSLWVKT